MAHNAGPAPIRGVSCIYNILILPVSPILAVVYKTIYGNGHIFNKKRLLSWDGALAQCAGRRNVGDYLLMVMSPVTHI